MAVDSPSLMQLITDANDNYINSRFENASLSFDHISDLCIQEEYIEEECPRIDRLEVGDWELQFYLITMN